MDVGSSRGGSCKWDVNFDAPVFLPATVALVMNTVEGNAGAWSRSDFGAWNSRSGRRHLHGSVHAL
jgi:hypothetical protein